MRSRGHSLSLFVSPTPLVKVPQRRAVSADPLPLPTQPPGQSRTPRELWLALHLPQLMLDALGGAIAKLRVVREPVKNARNRSANDQSRRDSSVTPTGIEAPTTLRGLAIVDLERGGKVVCACDAAATAAGIAPGMALNSALALLPGLHTLARNPQREHGLLIALAEWALRFSPRVSLEPPDAVLFEVRGSLKLFGGSRRLYERLRAQLRAAGLEPHCSLTPTPMASLWMARTGREGVIRHPTDLPSRLADLPIHCTRWPERSLETLATMGVRTVGDCLRLPRDGFARRFEPHLLDMLDRAVGRRPDPRVNFIPRERFAAGRDLEPEIEDAACLDEACAPLLDELGAFLRKRRGSVQALELRLVHREAPPTRLRLRFVGPVTDTTRIAALLRERLTRTALPAPVRALRLRSDPVMESWEASAELFAMDRRQSGAGVPQLVERLRARLGTEAVYGLCLIPEHRPESAWRMSEPSLPVQGRNRGRGAKSKCATASAEGKPLWLLAEPQPLDGSERPCFEGALELEQGPERIESGWWDGRDVQRDYYIARNPAGVRLWVFRDRDRASSAGAMGAPEFVGRWFLHGVFS
jgi:protein ImuB